MGMNVNGMCSSDLRQPGTQSSAQIMSTESRLIMFMLELAEEYAELTVCAHAHLGWNAFRLCVSV